MMIICINAPHSSQTQTNCLGMIYKAGKGLDSSQLLDKRSPNGSGPLADSILYISNDSIPGNKFHRTGRISLLALETYSPSQWVVS